jgi:dCTP deaminase
MILTDREIQIAIDSGAIIVEPEPSDAAYSSTSLDLTLDKTLTLFKNRTDGIETCIDPSAKGFNHEKVLSEVTQQFTMDAERGFDFPPGTLLLAWTIEFIELKSHSRLAARVEGKSSMARLGIGVHLTAPTIHAGFSGQIRLEMVNHSSIPVKLKPGMRICQLIFEQTIGTPVRGYRGRFSGQTAAERKG